MLGSLAPKTFKYESFAGKGKVALRGSFKVGGVGGLEPCSPSLFGIRPGDPRILGPPPRFRGLGLQRFRLLLLLLLYILIYLFFFFGGGGGGVSV